MTVAATTLYTVDELIEEAATQTGLRDFDEGDGNGFREALGQLLDSLEREAQLSDEGRANTRQALVDTLVGRLYLVEAERQHPEIVKIPVEQPIFVVGLPRTGTTMLHTLLSQDPGLWAPQLWELMYPVTPPKLTDATLLERARAYVKRYYQSAPAFRLIHPLSADAPEECHRLIQASFATKIFQLRFHVPSYGAWIDRADRVPGYRIHRRYVRHMLRRRPGERTLFKSPFHIWSLDALFSVYPDARIVHMHRDPRKSIPSLCSLVAAIRAPRSDHGNSFEIGRYCIEDVKRGLGRMMAFRARSNAPILDVQFDAMMRTPIETIGEIYEWCGMRLDDGAARRMRDWLARHPKHGAGGHTYEASTFGLTSQQFDTEFADYRQLFQVKEENA